MLTPEVEATALLGRVVADRYRVDAVIGTGAMGTVLRCRHLVLDHDVALKLLHSDLCLDRETSARFAREARSASRLDHPNCVRVLDVGLWQSNDGVVSQYLCMELVAGVELTRHLERPVPIAFAVSVVRQVLAGLAHAHARGVVHRDVKPENVIAIDEAGGAVRIKLIDFGIAKLLGDGARVTRDGRVCGTPHYMSPEQILGGAVDGRADLYAVGVLLFRMLEGRLPFGADDPRKVMQQHVEHAPPPLSARVPERLRELVRHLLEKNPERRPQDAAAALAELDARTAVMPVIEPRTRLRRWALPLVLAFVVISVTLLMQRWIG